VAKRSRSTGRARKRVRDAFAHPLWLIAVVTVVALKLATAGVGYLLAQDTSRFDRQDYRGEYYHAMPDSRLEPGGKVSFFDIWNYSDSEWYLEIARGGYPKLDQTGAAHRATGVPGREADRIAAQKYAFFPLFPWTVRLAGVVLPLKPAAFLVVFVAGLGAACCLALLWDDFFPGRQRLGLLALLLTFLFPFAIFTCLYFTEGPFLFLSAAALLALQRRRWLLAGLAGALLSLTRPTGVLLAVPVLLEAVRRRPTGGERQPRLPALLVAAATVAGVLPFALLNRLRTGSWITFASVQHFWSNASSIAQNFYGNVVYRALHFGELEFHRFHSSRVDFLLMLAFAACLVFMWRDRGFPRTLTVWSTVLWVVPLLTKDLMSFSRYMSVSFPVFMFLALRLPRASRYLVLPAFAIGYYFALRAVVFYNWVG
jgi:hypothetical protein